jgi:hypothetical protein
MGHAEPEEIMITETIVFGLIFSGKPKNLLINGDFRHGDRGFVTSYGLSKDLLGDGTYCIGQDPHNVHPGACSVHSHRDGHSSMMLLNGSATEHLMFWGESVKVQPHHKYRFTGWATSWSMNPLDHSPSDYSPARVYFVVNGKRIGVPFVVDGKSGDWKQFEFDWDSGDVLLAKIRLGDENTDVVGNDFAIDDLSFAENLEDK